jgi:hypothetical protein
LRAKLKLLAAPTRRYRPRCQGHSFTAASRNGTIGILPLAAQAIDSVAGFRLDCGARR